MNLTVVADSGVEVKMEVEESSPRNTNLKNEMISITEKLLNLKEKAQNRLHILFQFKEQNKLMLTDRQSNHSLIDESWAWNDPSFVHLPISIKYRKLRKERGQSSWVPKWNIILLELTKLKSALDEGGRINKIGDLIQQTVGIYNSQFQAKPYNRNFEILNSPQLNKDLSETLPTIVDYALQLKERLATPIPILKGEDSQTIYMDQHLACSLLANAFFCTFPNHPDGIPEVNFAGLFNCEEGELRSMKVEKLKCILHYFKRMKNRTPQDNYLISFERRVHTGMINWEDSKNKLSQVKVEFKGTIESQENMLQLDFANKFVGGGILGNGTVQEEIRFSICPELIVSRLFTEVLRENEVLVITGCEQFSNYSGYKSTFKFDGNHNDHQNIDGYGRRRTQVVAMDAYHFRNFEKCRQYEKRFVDRELLKGFTAFEVRNPQGRFIKPIATGNWGCGYFNGDPELKFLIQLLAASQANSRPLLYLTFGNVRQKESFEKMVNFLYEKKVSVGLLYKSILKYEKQLNSYTFNGPSVFAFVENYVKKN